MVVLIGLGVIGLILTLLGAFLYDYFFQTQELRRAENMAQDLLQSALDKEQMFQEQMESAFREKEQELRQVHSRQMENLKYENRQIRINIDKENSKNNRRIQDIKRRIQEAEKRLEFLQKERKNRFQKDLENFKNWEQIQKQYVEKLKKHFSLDVESIKKEIAQQEISETQKRAEHTFQKTLENMEKDSERMAVKILYQVLNRFAKPYCSERGINAVVFKSASSLEKVLGPQREFLTFIEKQCGVDVIVDEKELSLSIQGLDPVRREWGRLSLSKLSRKNRLNKGVISSVLQSTKREVFRKIRKDGQRVCHNLKLKGVALEVCDMMGALRYRYSFAQNQHFHCEEVGWLCGLLALELGVKSQEFYNSRRAGLFHDIGKAMDHAQSGGHAMIGADFIKKHNENERVIQAVRAHHNDVHPRFYLDFLVIAADAISGSRPGARRSTMESYSQKVLNLERIGKEFDGVKDIYVMNAGREVRVIVNSKKINDEKALKLSQQMAQRIEEECSYPGWIKVTVVRKVEAHQMTQMAQ